jgi:hypothetical protein
MFVRRERSQEEEEKMEGYGQLDGYDVDRGLGAISEQEIMSTVVALS